jgi:hypothetical protein
MAGALTAMGDIIQILFNNENSLLSDSDKGEELLDYAYIFV